MPTFFRFRLEATRYAHGEMQDARGEMHTNRTQESNTASHETGSDYQRTHLYSESKSSSSRRFDKPIATDYRLLISDTPCNSFEHGPEHGIQYIRHKDEAPHHHHTSTITITNSHQASHQASDHTCCVPRVDRPSTVIANPPQSRTRPSTPSSWTSRLPRSCTRMSSPTAWSPSPPWSTDSRSTAPWHGSA